MYCFKNDYSEGAHPRILNALVETNLDIGQGYGEDQFTEQAIAILKERIGCSNVDIHLFPGGTQTNLTALSAFLRPHEAAISAATGHILVHETGAIEATGHKVISVETVDGKLTPDHVLWALDSHVDEHMVKPKLVYISNATEIGSVYSKGELQALSRLCREKNLYLYVDGARLGSALRSKGNDLKMEDLAELTDAFYIGGTKNGALLGEALVICKDSLKEDFRFHIKQKGALLAKGRLLGIQFLELFRDDLFYELADHANGLAQRLREGIVAMGYGFLTDSPSNQLFPILPNSLITKLEENYTFIIWSKVDHDTSAIRLVTSWATQDIAIDSFLRDLKAQ